MNTYYPIPPRTITRDTLERIPGLQLVNRDDNLGLQDSSGNVMWIHEYEGTLFSLDRFGGCNPQFILEALKSATGADFLDEDALTDDPDLESATEYYLPQYSDVMQESYFKLADDHGGVA